ncbi:hypothetical protein RBXJA2T_06390, partial [Rubrivivax benzoatilyticus JA2 = ATCC BAA-35]
MTDRTIPAVSAAGRVAPVLATLALAAAVAWPGVAGAQ